ncbi:MAG: tetratricopeptide repeat protein [Bacteroidota bacterium]
MSDSNSSFQLDEMFFEADALIAQGKITEAISTLEAILVEDASFGKAYNHLGWIYETKFKDYAKAEEFYKKCYAYRPDYPAIYLNLSILLSTLGKYDELENFIKKGLEVAGTDKAALTNELGIMYELKGDYNKAIEQFKQAVRFSLNDTNVDTYSKSIQRCKKKMEVLG